MNHRVPAQRCLAGKSGLASLIIVRALALPVPRVSPAPASRGVFFAARLARLVFVCSQQQVRSAPAAKKTCPGGPEQPRGLSIHPGGSSKGKEAGKAAPGAPRKCRFPLSEPCSQGQRGARGRGVSEGSPAAFGALPGSPTPRALSPGPRVAEAVMICLCRSPARRLGIGEFFLPRGGWGRLQSPSPAMSQAPLHGHTRMHAGTHT